jgi:hypothetical protein
MPAISDNLMHFLGRQHKESPNKQLDIFKLIVSKGLRCSNIQIKFGDGGLVHNQVVCFTDIPLSECDEHAAIYGKFGIGFKKSFVKKNGGNPVRYFVDYLPSETADSSLVENRGMLYHNICFHFQFMRQLEEFLRKDPEFQLYDKNQKVLFGNKKLQEWIDQQIAIFSYEKETGDLGPARDETKEIDLYYKEREWRLVPLNSNFISGSAGYDEEERSIYYKFYRSDVNVIVTPNDEVRTEVLKYLLSLDSAPDQRMKEFADNPVPIVTYDDLHKW